MGFVSRAGTRRLRGRNEMNLELLESREAPYTLSPFSFANPLITVSIVPDGTSIDGFSSDLSGFDSAFLEGELSRAMQTWAAVTSLFFEQVADSGLPYGTPGEVQGDSRFGDIRLGGYFSSANYLAYAYFPSAYNTKGGDVALNTRPTYDLYSVLLHEIGHSLGLGHSNVPGSVMWPTYSFHAGLSMDDIAGIQAIYGARLQEPTVIVGTGPGTVFDVAGNVIGKGNAADWGITTTFQVGRVSDSFVPDSTCIIGLCQ